jgi:hypothetical protein
MSGAMRATARAIPLVLAAACSAKPPAAELSTDWSATVAAVAARDNIGPLQESRLAAYTAVALYEGHAADAKANIRTLAGQVNGLWSLPTVDPETPVDGAVTAAEAARVVLDSLLGAGHDESRRVVDSIAGAQVIVRKSDGVRTDVRDRSLAHGRALAAAILTWAVNDGYAAARSRPARVPVPEQQWWGNLRTFALRNAGECSAPDTAKPAASTDSAPKNPNQGSMPAESGAVGAAVAVMHAAVAKADSVIASRREPAAPTGRRQSATAARPPELGSCVSERVRGRLRTSP